jgi:hypothetical protein
MSSNSSPTCNEGLTEQGIIWNKINREKYEFNRYKSPEICAEDPGGNFSANMELVWSGPLLCMACMSPFQFIL